MSNGKLYMLGAGIGGTVGSFIPGLWHASDFGMASILFSVIGGIAGIWVMYRLAN